jgi:hypothetical protein
MKTVFDVTPRERRSRVDWCELTGDQGLATRQIAWERASTVLAMRRAGFTLNDIAQRFGLHKTRVRQIEVRGEREQIGARVSPIEQWMRETQTSLRQIVGPLPLTPVVLSQKRDWLLIATPWRSA